MPRIFDLFSQVDPLRWAHARRFGHRLRRSPAIWSRCITDASKHAVPASSRAAEFIIALPIVDGPRRRRHRVATRAHFRWCLNHGGCWSSTTTTTPPMPWRCCCRQWARRSVTAYDGPDALKEARRWRPSVIFLDLGMPGRTALPSPTRSGATARCEMSLVALDGMGPAGVRQRTDAGRVRRAPGQTCGCGYPGRSARCGERAASGPQESTEEPLDDDRGPSA